MATVWEQVISPSGRSTLFTELQAIWDWADVTGLSDSTTLFWVDEAKTMAIRFDYDASAPATLQISAQYKSYYYHDNNAQTRPYKIEKTDTALIISYSNSGDAVNAVNCEKIIICNATNPNTNESEMIMIYLGSKSSSNQSMLFASDVATPVNMSEQDSNANVNAKTTNLIPFYSTASEFITTDVYKSLCEDIGAWYFGNVMINNRPYRMSGSVFAVDE